MGIQHVHGTKRIRRDFKKAKECFEKALVIDPNDKESNYYLGLMYLQGLGIPINVQKSMSFFEKGIAFNDSRSLNALGYIYYEAPDYLEIDPVKLSKFGSVRGNLKKAKDYFLKAS